MATAAADNNHAMAHWGVAISNLYPLWAPPPPSELFKANTAMEKAQTLGAKNDLELDFIEAISTFYRKADTVDDVPTFELSASIRAPHASPNKTLTPLQTPAH